MHLLKLLCIPAIALVYYYKKVPDANLKGSLFALLLSVVLVAAVLYGVVPGIITVGGWFELFFTNTLGMPFNTGTIIYIALLIASFIWGIYETYQDKNPRRQNIAFLAALGLIGIPFYGYGWAAFFTGLAVLALVYVLLLAIFALYADVVYRLLFICCNRYTLNSQSTNGSEFTRGYLYFG